MLNCEAGHIYLPKICTQKSPQDYYFSPLNEDLLKSKAIFVSSLEPTSKQSLEVQQKRTKASKPGQTRAHLPIKLKVLGMNTFVFKLYLVPLVNVIDVFMLLYASMQ